MKRCQSRSSPSRSGPKDRRNALKTRSPAGSWEHRPAVGVGIGDAQQVDEGQELLGTLGAQVIDQGPGLGIEIALVTAAEAGVADQPLQSDRRLDLPPVGKPQVVGAADARPAATADHLELRRKPLVHPVGKRVVTRHRARCRPPVGGSSRGPPCPGRSPASRDPAARSGRRPPVPVGRSIAWPSARPTPRAGSSASLIRSRPRTGMRSIASASRRSSVPSCGQGIAGRALLLAAPRVISHHGVPRRVKIAARRGECVGILLVEERQVVLPIGEPRRHQAMVAGPATRCPGRRTGGGIPSAPAPGARPARRLRPPNAGGAGSRAARAPPWSRSPAPRGTPAMSGSSHGRSSRSSRATIRAVGPCFGSIAWSSRSSSATSIVSPFSMAHHTAAYRAANTPVRASRRRASHSVSGQNPGTRLTMSSRNSSTFPSGIARTTRFPSTVAGSCASPPFENKSDRLGSRARPARFQGTPSGRSVPGTTLSSE